VICRREIPGEIDAADSESLASLRRASEEPGGYAEIAGDPMTVVAVVNIRQTAQRRWGPPHAALPTNRRPSGAGPRGMSSSRSSAKKAMIASRS
jgi:hypothetical protein